MYAHWRSLDDYETMRRDPGPAPYLQEALTIAEFEPVVMCAPDDYTAQQAWSRCGEGVEVITAIPTDDLWMRDIAPVFRRDGYGGLDTVGPVALKQGTNVLVFKVINEKADWSGCARFTDKDGNPIKKLKAGTKPE